MVIENAERMGLAQLHQLRGRVGRGTAASTCVLLYRAPLSALARERLKVIRESTDGFEIARRDLALRGPGELLGTRQTGLAQLRVADLMRDAELLPQVQQTAELLLAAYPEHIAGLAARWIGRRALRSRRQRRARATRVGGCARSPGHALAAPASEDQLALARISWWCRNTRAACRQVTAPRDAPPEPVASTVKACPAAAAASRVTRTAGRCTQVAGRRDR
jgi:hypothetical protein